MKNERGIKVYLINIVDKYDNNTIVTLIVQNESDRSKLKEDFRETMKKYDDWTIEDLLNETTVECLEQERLDEIRV